jgi:imidazolonepropionase-like amidohydrolase
MKNYILTLVFLCSLNVGIAQQTPAVDQQKTILITGATAHIGDGSILENSAIGLRDGKIIEVTTAGAVQNQYDTTIDAKGQHVYPGFIATNSTVGMVEVDAVRATNDLNEIGTYLPHIRTIIAYNAESKVVESLRPNGILSAQVVPTRGVISGSSSVVKLDAWNWEDAALVTDEGLHINWPRAYTSKRRNGTGEIKYNQKSYEDRIKMLGEFLKESSAYNQSFSKTKHLPFAAMKQTFAGAQTVYIHANSQREIVDGIQFLKEHQIDKIVLVGGNEAHLVTDFLKEHNIPVIVSRPHRLPTQEDQDIKLPFKMAKLLMDAGLLVTVDVSGRMERMNTRNLPFYAGSFAAYGVPKEKAVEMITLNAAKIIGVADRLGSLTVGKDATLFLSIGDALDMRTNQLTHAFIEGRALSLETHQTELWKRYMEKYSRK